jgi:hypothetical protein
MSSTTDIAAIDEMIRAKFDAATITRIVGQPSLTSVRLLVDELAKIVAGCKTSKWGGKHGHLKVVLGKDKYRLVLAQPELDCTVVGKPSIAPTDFVAGDDANSVEKKKAAHKILWREYQMQEAVNEIGVEKIVEAVDAQYVEQLEAEYVGYTGVTIFSMLKHLRTWYKVTNAQQLAGKTRFAAPWSETPNAHVTTYARQLDRRQVECGELNVTITDDDKILQFIGEMFASELFDRKFLDDWEDAETQGWKDTVAHFADEYGKISRARERAAERSGGDYSSAAALTSPPPDTIAAVTEYAQAQRDYANALELRVDELQTLVDDQSILTTGTEQAAAATTQTRAPSAELLEMRTLAKSLADTNATQQRQLTTALAQLKTKDAGVAANPGVGGGGDRHRARRGAPRVKHICKNCKREVWHADARCMELEENKHLRYDGWKSCLG